MRVTGWFLLWSPLFRGGCDTKVEGFFIFLISGLSVRLAVTSMKKLLTSRCIPSLSPSAICSMKIQCLILLAVAITSVMHAAPLSGTKTIGPAGDYASIGAAIADVQAQTLGGALVLELKSDYVSAVETFPLVFTNLTTTAANTLTLRPAVDAVALSITSANTTAATVDLNDAQFVTIDGRAGR